MNPETRKPPLSERLARYSAVASLTAAGALAMGPGALKADPIEVADGDLPAYVSNGFFDIDFDQDGNPEFRVMHNSTSTGYTTLFSTTTTTTGGGTTMTFYTTTYFTYYYRVGLEALTNTGATNPSDRDGGQGVLGYSNPGQGIYWFADIWPSYLSSHDVVSAGASTWQALAPGDLAQLRSYAFFSGPWTTNSYGDWYPGDIGYLGVRFHLNGDTTQMYYGWIELYIDEMTGGVTVERYGYNTTPDAPIPAAVEMSDLQVASGLRTVGAAVLGALGAALTWVRRKVKRK
jgi:hypothetical protein